MKIALVTPYDYPYPGGVNEHIRHLDREFRARGHETRIIAPSTEPEGALAPNVIKVSGDVLPIPFNGSIARITLSPEVAQRVAEVLSAEQFDIVHLHEPEAPLVGWAVLHASRAVNVGTFHAYCEGHAFSEYTQPIIAWANAQLDGRVFVSPAVRDAAMQYLTGEYRVIPNGIDYARFAAPDVEPLAEFDDGRPNVLFVGRLEARKGFHHLLQAYPQVKRAVPDARLLVVGAFSDEDKARLAGEVRSRDLHDVHLIGRVSREELPRYYRSATVFCAPSTGGESFGIVLLEAMAAGLPVVASDIVGYRTVMRHGEEGYLAPPGDEQALAESLIALLQDRERRAAMAARGSATAARYDWPVVAPRVLGYYEELIDRRAAGYTREPYEPATRGAAPDPKTAGMTVLLGTVMNELGRQHKDNGGETMTQRSILAGSNPTVIIRAGASVQVEGWNDERVVAEANHVWGLKVEQHSESEFGRVRAKVGDRVLFDVHLDLAGRNKKDVPQVTEVQIGGSGKVLVPLGSSVKVYAGRNAEVRNIQGHVWAYAGRDVRTRDIRTLVHVSAGRTMDLDSETLASDHVKLTAGRDLRLRIRDLDDARIVVDDLGGYWVGVIGIGRRQIRLKAGGDVTLVTEHEVKGEPPYCVLGRIEPPGPHTE